MVTAPLPTKLYVPSPRPNAVMRSRLIDRLNTGLRQGHRLTLLSAPAGFGKTMLVSDWIAHVQTSERSRAPTFLWLALDAADNDPTQFVAYLIAALQQVDERIGQTAQQLLQAPQVSPQSLAASLINDLAGLGMEDRAWEIAGQLSPSNPYILVLDDYHLITSPAVHDIVRLLLDRHLPSLHLVVGTREDPPLPLSRLRARAQVTEIRERDLRFTTEEVAAFLRQTMSLDLSAAAVAALTTRTEGWIAGLQLAALALHENLADADTFITAFTGDDRYIVEYLVDEVLQHLPAHLRTFVLQTSILDRMCGPLCDAVLGIGDRGSEIRTESPTPGPRPPVPGSYSQLILEELERANLFLVPLDHRREWYRFHYLFAEFLRTRLSPEERQTLHRRAAGWYAAAGLPHEAIRHALAVSDFERAEQIIRRTAEEMIQGGSLLTVRSWLGALPDSRVRADGELAIYKGWALALSGEVALAQEYARAAEAAFREQAAPQSGALLVLRGYTALLAQHDEAAAIELATAALRALPQDQPRWRIQALWTIAEAQERTRPIAEAIHTLREACRVGRTLGNQMFAVMAEFFLATALSLHGQRREAMAVCEAAIVRYTDSLGRLSPLAALLSSRLGILHYEANQLDTASQHFDRGRALGQQLGSDAGLLFTTAYTAPVLHARGETNAALEHLQTARQLARQTDVTDAGWILALEVNIRLQQSDLAGALRSFETAGLSPDNAPEYLRMEQHLAYARLLLAQDRLVEARRLLAHLEQFVSERGLYRWLITIHLLLALAAERTGDQAVARDQVAEALRVAAPENYIRAFLDEDMRVCALLREVRRKAPQFVDQVLAHAGAADSLPQAKRPSLVEPLSARELEVLRLIVAGLSNPEIAQELVISIGTVKRHINHIYGKLDAQSRTQAVAKARVLGLLDRDA
jgi:LuxR family transcriptional regulator, maltose regulon positive regulatory protein